MTPSLPKPRVWGRSSPHQGTMFSSKTPQHGYSFSPQTDGPFPARDRQAWAQKESPARFLFYGSRIALLQETFGDSGKMRLKGSRSPCWHLGTGEVKCLSKRNRILSPLGSSNPKVGSLEMKPHHRAPVPSLRTEPLPGTAAT